MSTRDILVISAAARLGEEARIITECNNVLSKNPGDYLASLWLADTYWRMKDWGKAIEPATRACSVDSKCFHAVKVLTGSHFELGNHEQAYKYAKILIKLKPPNWRIGRLVFWALAPLSWINAIANIRARVGSQSIVESSSNSQWLSWARKYVLAYDAANAE